MIKRALYNFLGSKVAPTAKIRGWTRLKKSRVRALCELGKHSRISDSEIGESCEVGKHCRLDFSNLESNNIIGSRSRLMQVEMGRFSYVADHVNLTNVKIGRFCSIGPNLINHLGNHPTRTFVSTHPAFYSPDAPTETFVDSELFQGYGGPVSIGHDVWIGADVLMMDGVSIGTGAVVAARSVVTKDVPPYAIVGGSPAKLIRYRFGEEEIKKLIASAWWDRDIEWIRERVSLFENVAKFLRNSDV